MCPASGSDKPSDSWKGRSGKGCWARWFGRFGARSGMLIPAGGLAGWTGAHSDREGAGSEGADGSLDPLIPAAVRRVGLQRASCVCAWSLQLQPCSTGRAPLSPPRLSAIWTSEFWVAGWALRGHNNGFFIVSLCMTYCISIFHFLLDPVSFR